MKKEPKTNRGKYNAIITKAERIRDQLYKLQKQAEELAPFGLEFFNCSHLYGIARKGEARQIYIKYE